MSPLDSDLFDSLSSQKKTVYGKAMWLDLLRWIVLLPGVIIGATIVHAISRLGMWLGSSRFSDDTWFDLIWREVFTNGIYGAAIVTCAFWIAPRGKAIVATVFAGLVLFLSGYLVFYAVAKENWISLVGVTFMNIGSIWSAVAAWAGELG